MMKVGVRGSVWMSYVLSDFRCVKVHFCVFKTMLRCLWFFFFGGVVDVCNWCVVCSGTLLKLGSSPCSQCCGYVTATSRWQLTHIQTSASHVWTTSILLSFFFHERKEKAKYTHMLPRRLQSHTRVELELCHVILEDSMFISDKESAKCHISHSFVLD